MNSTADASLEARREVPGTVPIVVTDQKVLRRIKDEHVDGTNSLKK